MPFCVECAPAFNYARSPHTTSLEVDKYVAYPEVMATVVEYVRRELVRLERIPDEAIIGKGQFGTESEGLEQMKFGPVRSQEGLIVALKAASDS